MRSRYGNIVSQTTKMVGHGKEKISSMRTIFIGELKMNSKAFWIWSLAVGGLGLACILLYQSMQGDMKEMADAFSNMGAFSDAFGMSTLSIATLKGYFATEVGTVHGLGSGMFAAILAIGILSKEEEGHTGEFLFSMPVTRKGVLCAKGLCVLVLLLGFTILCGLLYGLGFVMLSEELPAKELVIFMWREFLMNLEVGAVCFGLSAVSGKNRMGLGIGMALILYFYDLIGRVVPDLGDYLYLGPYSFANASEIFSGIDTPGKAFVAAGMVIIAAITFAFICYDRRDLAS